jgi:hypothetical protein
VLLILFCVLAPLGLLTAWAHALVFNTDRYVATVDQLADNGEIQNAISTAVTNAIFNRYGSVLGSRLTTQQVEGAVHDVIGSAQFASYWSTANRAVHADIVALLRGDDQSGVLATRNGQIVLDLGPVVEAVKNRLQETGVDLSSVPVDPQQTTEFVIVGSNDLVSAQRVVHLFDQIGLGVPIAAVVALVGAIAVAVDRRRALLRAGVGLALSMAVLLIVLLVGRSLYLDALGSSVSRDAAAAVFDIVVRRLAAAAIVLLAVGVVTWVASLLVHRGRSAGGLPVTP